MGDRKKGSVPQFKLTMHISEEQARENWKSLRAAIVKIFNFEGSTLSFEELYRYAYNLVLHKFGDMLYQGLTEAFTERCKMIYADLLKSADSVLFKELEKQWNDFKTTMGMIKDILMYMDRNYVTQKHTKPAFDLGLSVFRDQVVMVSPLNGRIKRLLLNNIKKERCGELIERALLKSIINMLVELGLKTKETYQEVFERDFLEETAHFYNKEAQDFITSNPCPEYLKKAEARLKEEMDRLEAYLDPSSEIKLLSVVDKCYIENHSKTLVQMEYSGCKKLMENMQISDLKRMFFLFSRIPNCPRVIADCMGQLIIEKGQQITSDPEYKKKPVNLVNQMLKLVETFNTIVKEAFDRDTMMETVMKISFEKCINENTRTALALTLYVDRLFRKEIKGMREDEIDARLDDVITIFRFISDKDIFENLYKEHLAKRLLQSRSLSDDAERLMITKLKTECGYQFTAKLEGMFNDMKLSKESISQYSRSAGVELEVRVLTTSFWPHQQVPPVTLPEELWREAERFKTHYLQKHTGRRLAWKTDLGNAEMRGVLGSANRKHELIVSTYQMCALMMYNSHEVLSLDEIHQTLHVADPEFNKHLLGLIKIGILCKSTEGKDLLPSTELSLNPTFQSRMFRIKVPVLVSKEKDQIIMKEEIPEVVEEDRKHLLEAIIVRVMKSRRVMEHTQLIAEVTRQVANRFIPAPKMIKSRIEGLIDREYLERDKEDSRNYRYLA